MKKHIFSYILNQKIKLLKKVVLDESMGSSFKKINPSSVKPRGASETSERQALDLEDGDLLQSQLMKRYFRN